MFRTRRLRDLPHPHNFKISRSSERIGPHVWHQRCEVILRKLQQRTIVGDPDHYFRRYPREMELQGR